MRKTIALFATRLLLAGCASERIDYNFASAPVDAPEARINFIQHNPVYSWHVVNDRLLYVQTRGRDWYEVKLFSACVELPFATQMSFMPSDASGAFDRFSNIRIRGGQTCKVDSVKAVPPPDRAVMPYSASRARSY